MDTCNKGIFIKVWSTCTRDNIQVVANVAIALAFFVTAYTAYLQQQATRLQVQALQLSVFHEMSKEIEELQEVGWDASTPVEENSKWLQKVLRVYDKYAFLEVEKVLPPKIIEYYGLSILETCDVLQGVSYDVALKLGLLSYAPGVTTYKYLRQFYKNYRGKDLYPPASKFESK